MAGMLPGVEAARRRKFHQNINHNYNDATATATTTRSSFSLYANNHKFQINSTSSMGNFTGLVFSDDEKLEAVARAAKKRLDQKLQTHRKSAEIKRSERNSNGGGRGLRRRWALINERRVQG